jgi:Fumarate reductase flavoprotein C-term/2Fe-2S iron-sulfur cluster binding domain
VQIDLQEMMQSLVGIVRRKEEMVRALDGLGKLWNRSQNVAVHGHREYNPGWHTAIDLKHLLTVSEAITRSALERKESRGGHFRDDFPNKDAAGGKMNIVLRKDVDGLMRAARANPRTVFKIWRGDANGGDFVEYIAEISEGMVVLDAVHEIQATQPNDLACRWNCKAGKCGSCSAEINGMPKLMCMTRLDELPLDTEDRLSELKQAGGIGY